MCGRITLTKSKLEKIPDDLEAFFDSTDVERYKPRYNGAPTDLHWVLILDDEGKRRIIPAVWGPPGSKAPIINVRAESVAKGAFRSRKHSLAITDGYYEWLREGKTRRPFWYHDPDQRLILMAALDTPLTSSSKAPVAFSIVTVPANAMAAPIHDRMPAIIAPSCIDEWLSKPALELLHPAPDDALIATEVSRRVNRVANDDPDCLAPPESVKPSDGKHKKTSRQLSLLDDDGKH